MSMAAPSVRLASLAFLVAIASAPVTARAALLLTGANSVPCAFNADYAWNPVAGGDNAQFPGASGKPNFWKATIDTAAAGGNINVTAKITHDTGAGCGGANPNSITLTLSSVVPAKKNQILSNVTAGEVTHGKATDVGFLKTTVQTNNTGGTLPSTVRVAGNHSDTFPVKASFSNEGTRVITNLTVTPDYDVIDFATGNESVKDGPPIPAAPKGGVAPGGSTSTQLPDQLDLTSSPNLVSAGLTSFRIVGSGSPPTDTELAFLGTNNGNFGELDMGAMLDLLLGPNEFFAPFLRPVLNEDTLALYVGVDLTQWVGLDGTFSPGEVFSLTDGTSDALPGVIVGTSPVTLGANGFQTDAPYTGDVVATGTIDGGIVPEPSSLILMATALGLISLRWRHTGRV
jgi:hypothetical protein